MNFIYSVFIGILILLKFMYTFISTYLFVDKNNNFTEHYQKIDTFNEKLFIISEFGLFLLLIIVFFPFSQKNIIITWHEKLLFFFLGVVGLFHVNYKFIFNKV